MFIPDAHVSHFCSEQRSRVEGLESHGARAVQSILGLILGGAAVVSGPPRCCRG